MKLFGIDLDWRLNLMRKMAPHLGWWKALMIQAAEDWNRIVRLFRLPWMIREIHVRPAGYEADLAIRIGSSDLWVYEQVFILQQYLPVTSIEDPLVVFDCGANAGYASAFFLHHFPRARVIAVEPDPENAALCRRNLAAYRERALVVEKAVWSSVSKLKFVNETRKPGAEWGIRVERSTAARNEEALEAVDIASLMAMAKAEQIDLLKIDIERSEIEIFNSNPHGWLSRVSNIAIELHGPDCVASFRSAMKPYSFDELESGELTICLGIRQHDQNLEGRDSKRPLTDDLSELRA